MIGKYVYSLNGSEYTGQFETREAAEHAGLIAARKSETLIESFYVGRNVAPDPMASGHARAVISNMIARSREQSPDGSFSYLAKVSEAQVDELDAALENAVLGWLAKHDLLPRFFKVESISEHPVPVASVNKKVALTDTEVYDLGVGRSYNGN